MSDNPGFEKEKKVITLGTRDITLGAIHSYTYPDVIKSDDLKKIDAFLQIAALFDTWLTNDAPQSFKSDSINTWKKYVNLIQDMIKITKATSPMQLIENAISYAWLDGDPDLNRYPFDRVQMIDYYNDVFWYTVNLSLTASVGDRLTDKNGKMIKRLRNSLYKIHNREFPDCFWQFLGGMIKGYGCEPSKTIYWRITDNLLWTDGSFADPGSCMMSLGGSYRDGLRALITSGAYAIQFFSSEMPKFHKDGERKHYTNGIGRAWLVKKEDGNFFLFNGYGSDVLAAYSYNAKCTDKIAQILGEFVGIDSYTANFKIHPGDSLYVNDGGTCRYFPVDGQRIDTNHYTFNCDHNLDIGADDEDESICKNCGRRIPEGNEFNENGDTYCERCHNELFSFCESCDEYHDNDYMNRLYDDSWVCDDCLRRYYTECEYCYEYFPNDMIFDAHNQNDDPISVCQNCLDYHGYTSCDNCGELYHPDRIETVDDAPYCLECAKEKKESEESTDDDTNQ